MLASAPAALGSHGLACQGRCREIADGPALAVLALAVDALPRPQAVRRHLEEHLRLAEACGNVPHPEQSHGCDYGTASNTKEDFTFAGYHDDCCVFADACFQDDCECQSDCDYGTASNTKDNFT